MVYMKAGGTDSWKGSIAREARPNELIKSIKLTNYPLRTIHIAALSSMFLLSNEVLWSFLMIFRLTLLTVHTQKRDKQVMPEGHLVPSALLVLFWSPIVQLTEAAVKT